ncbi:hypothetical protein Cni_G18288 [Canna indica]|uniref:Uncharacterized protein n=1 Tax=Canna indica TaxID=4628 RepID=A0AAQ3KJ73_9LILI|nr:hypothetical protein Cni_G18288 [Canna indica]
MHDPYYARSDVANVDHHSSNELMTPDAMPPNTGHVHENADSGLSAQRSDSLTRHRFQNNIGPRKTDEFNNRLLDPQIMELYYRSRMQEEEILLLRKEVNDAYINELHLLNEKHILERKLCELRIALDEKQDDAISSAMKELTKKRSYFEENLRLANNLKDVEEEMYFLTSSLLSLLAEYDIRPPLFSSSTISSGIKQLYQHMQWKIRSYANFNDMNHQFGNQPDNIVINKNVQPPSSSRNQLSHAYMEPVIPELHLHGQYPMNLYEKSTSNQKMDIKDANITPNSEVPYPSVIEKQKEFPSDSYREVGAGAPLHMPTMTDNQGSFISEGEFDLPAIVGFQIYGEAQPGRKLLACGYPTNGTTLCIFQWVRELDDGTRQYIEGATVPEYVVTADDVDTILAVDCTPIDESGRQGDLVRQFANNQKITCDPEMKHYIDSCISAGKAVFNVKLLIDSSDWEQAVLLLKRSTYLIKAKSTDRVVVEEKYSQDLKIKVPLGYTTQFVLTCSEGINLPLSTDGTSQPHNLENDVRFRDIIVLTMRYFQSKALDAKRKVKV